MLLHLLTPHGPENYFNRRLMQECPFFSIGLKVENPYRLSLPLQPPAQPNQFTILRSTGVNYDDYDLMLMKYLETQHIPSLNPWGEHQLFRDKASQWQWYQSHRFPHIPTVMPKGPDILSYTVDQFKTNKFVVKTRRGNQSKGTWLINQTSGLKTWLAALQYSGDQNYIIQPFLHFRQEWRILYIGKKSWSFLKVPTNDREFLSGAEIPFRQEPASNELMELAGKVQKNLYANFFSIDIGLTEQGPVIIEVNLISGLEKAETASQQNLMRELLLLIQTLRKERPV
jgi:glutathione synthase/RimK-type ligase-like ATP-grasp enzyme